MHQPVEPDDQEPFGYIKFGWNKNGNFYAKSSVMGYEHTPVELTQSLNNLGKAGMHQLLTMDMQQIHEAAKSFDTMQEKRLEENRKRNTMYEITAVEDNVVHVNFRGVE